MMTAWMPHARPSATSTITASSMIELFADFERCLPVSPPRLAAVFDRPLRAFGVADIGGGICRLARGRWRIGRRVGLGLARGVSLDGALPRERALPLDGALPRLDRLLGGWLHDRLLRGHAIGVGRLDRRVVGHQTRLDGLLGSDVAALAHPRALSDAIAQVVELGAAHVAAGGQLDALDLRGMQGKHALHANAEGLLANREGLAGAVALALDDHALEDLHAAASALDHLEVDLHAVAR